MNKHERDLAAEVLQALAHPVRLGVIEVLAGGERNCKQLFEELGCSQSLMSQQLKILSRQGLISIRKVGTQKICTLQNRDFLKLFDCMHAHLRRFLHFKE